MSSAKFYVLGGGRWRQLDTATGRVEGWGGARFLYLERGRLRAVRRAPVLRGLRALAAGRARAVCDGAPLSQIRYPKAAKDKCLPCKQHAQCQHAYYGCGVNTHFNMQLQSVRTVHTGVQADLSHDLCCGESPNLPPQEQQSRAAVRNVTYKRPNNKMKEKIIVNNKQTDIIAHHNNKRLNSSDEDLSASIMEWNRKREKRGTELCKELIIAEEDIMLLRNFIEKDDRNVFKVDLDKFDADDTYKSKVFYKLNPLVNVERCKAIADMMWEQQSQSTVTLKDFITNLGLRRVDDPSPSRTSYKMRKRRDTRNPKESRSEQDKENLASKRQPKVNKRPNKVLGESVGGKPNSDRVKGKVKVSEVLSRATRGSGRLEESVVVEVSDSDGALERTEPATSPAQSAARHKRAAGGGREYSPAEDAAIVRWLRAGGRAHLVNGNRLWRELQPEHQRLTGHFRSWHSLRNRYLRYLLPSLDSLLPAPAAAALRAAAACGEIKARLPPRRHSLLALPPVTSAWARRPRLPEPTEPSEPHSGEHESLAVSARRDKQPENISGPGPTRSLRSNAPPALARVDTPTYSELTKRFAERHRSTPDSDRSDLTEPEKIKRRASNRLRASRTADFASRLDDVSGRQNDTFIRPVENSSNYADTPGQQTARSSRHADRSQRKADISNRQTHRSRRNADTSSINTDNRSQTTDSTDRRKHRTRRLFNPNL